MSTVPTFESLADVEAQAQKMRAYFQSGATLPVEHRKRALERGRHERGERRSAPMRAKDAPFTVAVDVPSGLSAQTGAAARPCLAADMTVTMLAYKPGLVATETNRWTGMVTLARLVDTKPYLAALGDELEDD